MYSFTILSDLSKLILDKHVTSQNFAWFDQNSSGPSFIAILSNSVKLGNLCNIITVTDPENFRELKRQCIYTDFLIYCNETITNLEVSNFKEFNFDRQ